MHLTRGLAPSLLMLAASALGACGGLVVFEPAGDGGGGSTSSSTSSSTVTSTTSGPSGCQDHASCGDAEVCIFGTGECATACGAGVPCAFGEVCDECATSSCPACRDCVAACVVGDDPPPPPPQPVCTSHDECPGQGGATLCLFDLGVCARPCGPGQPPCPPNQACDGCGTSSCPACDDCVSVCRP